MARPAQIKLPPIVHGDTWDGLSVSLTSSGTSLANDLANVVMTFRDASLNKVLELVTGVNVMITYPNPWQFVIPPLTPFPLNAGTYTWNIETTDSDGIIKTYLAGTIQVLQD